MGLFQTSILKNYLKGNEDKIAAAYKKHIAYFHNPERQKNIREIKEEQFQEGFLRELFVNVLGYTIFPEPRYSLLPEQKNVQDAKKADGSILVNGEVVGVIELKDGKTVDLKQIETQAFGYKNNHRKTSYVITSNFEKLRFYIENTIDFEEFNLFKLTVEDFAILWICLAYENIAKDLPKQLKNESANREEQITKQLYKEYSAFKRALFDDLVKLNPEYDPLTLFKKTQKLLDRLLFILFAEDSGLLPPNSIMEIIKKWETLIELDEYKPLYNILKQYFGYMNTGRKGKTHDIFAYNGGLFIPDDILDNISISDEVLSEHLANISRYDFSSEVDVNILGHIFEHSLTEIEEITTRGHAPLAKQHAPLAKKHAPLAQHAPLAKRKKDGVFYTPRYITTYIVENTLGKLCTAKKTEIEINESEFIADNKYSKAEKKHLSDKLHTYREWMLSLTICDPACGSGAFLNAALDFLMAEHKYIDELNAKLFGSSITLPNIENNILENNLYGVDINDESVEIAKLALWLRTAKPKRKLNSLNNNIKCGNSLISDPEVAGEKAFDWHKEFPQVFTEKNKKAFHITTAIHDSRTSQRMIAYKVRQRRNNGACPFANPTPLTAEDEFVITQTIAEIVKEDKLNVLAYNIGYDHLHILLVCENDELDKIVGKLKSMSARACNINRGVTIPQGKREGRGETQVPLWTQKFGCSEIKDETHLYNTINYIRNNRIKHELPAFNKEACLLVEDMRCSVSHAFRPEYNGGFDVVIGNPPYGVRLDNKDYLKVRFEKTSFGNIDSYKYFVQLGIEINKENGYMSFIMPDSYLSKEYFKDLRLFVSNKYRKIYNVKLGDNIFEEVNLPTSIICLQNKSDFTHNYFFKDISSLEFLDKQIALINTINFIDEMPDIENSFVTTLSIIDKANTMPLIEIYEQVMGVKVYQKGKGVPKQTDIELANNIFLSDKQTIDFQYPFVSQGIQRYYYENKNEFIKYGKWLAEPRELRFFTSPKIVIREIVNPRIYATFIEHEAVVKNIAAVVISKDEEKYPLKFLLALVNSKLINYYVFEQSAKSANKSYPSFNSRLLKNIPIKACSPECKKKFCDLAEKMLSLNTDLQTNRKQFLNLLSNNFPNVKITGVLENFAELEFKQLIAELAKQKISIPLKEQKEWEEQFNEYKQTGCNLAEQIAQTDKEIDRMVYELYGLTEEEVAVIEK